MNGERKPPTQAARVALYARVSSEKQAEEGTIASQVAVLEKRITDDGYAVDPQYRFIDDGVSGTTLVRPALERLRDLAAVGAIDRLYVMAPDRLARRHGHQMLLLEELQARRRGGVRESTAGNNTGRSTAGPGPRGHRRVRARQDPGADPTRSASCRTVRPRQPAVQAHHGYRYIDKHTGGGEARFEVIEEEAKVVRQIFTWVGRDGCSLREVARRLQQQGLRTEDRSLPLGLRDDRRHGAQLYLQRACVFWQKTVRRAATASTSPPGPTGGRQGHLLALPATRLGTHWDCCDGLGGCRIVCYGAGAAGGESAAFAGTPPRRPLPSARPVGLRLLWLRIVCTNIWVTTKVYLLHLSWSLCFGADPPPRLPQWAAAHQAVEAAVWADVSALLSEPQRLRQEFQRRQQSSQAPGPEVNQECLQGDVHKVRQSIGRLIDAYTAGLIETRDFEPRMQRLKERLAKLEGDLRLLTEQARQEEELRVVFSRVEDVAEQMKAGLTSADWGQKREILRALLKRVEVDKETLRLVYKVPLDPFVESPAGGKLQDCGTRLAGIAGNEVQCGRDGVSARMQRGLPPRTGAFGEGHFRFPGLATAAGSRRNSVSPQRLQ